MLSGMNIGARHILVLDAMAAILAGAGLAALAVRNRRWAWVGVVLVAAHIVSALSVYPNDMAYANEAWGGPKNLHTLLSDANLDWAQQLYQVKEWEDRHPGEECWFAYFASPVIDPAVYGIRCHKLPNADTGWLGGADLIPPEINGNVLISAGDLSGCELSSSQLNPYAAFLSRKPDEWIDYAVLVYHGKFQVHRAAAMSRVQRAYELLRAHKPEEALALAREAAEIDPDGVDAENARGNLAAHMGQKDEARAAWTAALAAAKQLEPDAGVGYIPELEGKLKRLSQ
jgi:tetratricopeptide (TPR) repeat protein